MTMNTAYWFNAHNIFCHKFDGWFNHHIIWWKFSKKYKGIFIEFLPFYSIEISNKNILSFYRKKKIKETTGTVLLLKYWGRY